MTVNRVTVLIPTLNRGWCLGAALESVVEQTLRPDEVIVIDDGSTDETASIVRNSPPVVKYLQQQNCGVSAARNRGITAARNEWIALLDSDDLWKPEKLALQMDFIERHPEVRIIQTDEVWIRNGKRVNPRNIHQKKSGWIFEACIPLCIVSPSAVIIHREVFETIGYFDEALPACEDYDFWLRAALRYPIHTLPEKLTIKQGGHADQLSRQWGLDRYRVQALQKILQDPMLSDKQRKLVVADIKRRWAILVKGYGKRGKVLDLTPNPSPL